MGEEEEEGDRVEEEKESDAEWMQEGSGWEEDSNT